MAASPTMDADSLVEALLIEASKCADTERSARERGQTSFAPDVLCTKKRSVPNRGTDRRLCKLEKNQQTPEKACKGAVADREQYSQVEPERQRKLPGLEKRRLRLLEWQRKRLSEERRELELTQARQTRRLHVLEEERYQLEQQRLSLEVRETVQQERLRQETVDQQRVEEGWDSDHLEVAEALENRLRLIERARRRLELERTQLKHEAGAWSEEWSFELVGSPQQPQQQRGGGGFWQVQQQKSQASSSQKCQQPECIQQQQQPRMAQQQKQLDGKERRQPQTNLHQQSERQEVHNTRRKKSQERERERRRRENHKRIEEVQVGVTTSKDKETRREEEMSSELEYRKLRLQGERRQEREQRAQAGHREKQVEELTRQMRQLEEEREGREEKEEREVSTQEKLRRQSWEFQEESTQAEERKQLQKQEKQQAEEEREKEEWERQQAEEREMTQQAEEEWEQQQAQEWEQRQAQEEQEKQQAQKEGEKTREQQAQEREEPQKQVCFLRLLRDEQARLSQQYQQISAHWNNHTSGRRQQAEQQEQLREGQTVAAEGVEEGVRRERRQFEMREQHKNAEPALYVREADVVIPQPQCRHQVIFGSLLEQADYVQRASTNNPQKMEGDAPVVVSVHTRSEQSNAVTLPARASPPPAPPALPSCAPAPRTRLNPQASYTCTHLPSTSFSCSELPIPSSGSSSTFLELRSFSPAITLAPELTVQPPAFIAFDSVVGLPFSSAEVVSAVGSNEESPAAPLGYSRHDPLSSAVGYSNRHDSPVSALSNSSLPTASSVSLISSCSASSFSLPRFSSSRSSSLCTPSLPTSPIPCSSSSTLFCSVLSPMPISSFSSGHRSSGFSSPPPIPFASPKTAPLLLPVAISSPPVSPRAVPRDIRRSDVGDPHISMREIIGMLRSAIATQDEEELKKALALAQEAGGTTWPIYKRALNVHGSMSKNHRSTNYAT
eukprot:gb/GEZN01001014.1/.p1 GENE.gb/GEZN01001014.1/~~gb/GEZN01001014.1/.p1  ORF type:complete len:956 (-),score=237.49 gb/GEZN01001014.1/:302-3169(-)